MIQFIKFDQNLYFMQKASFYGFIKMIFEILIFYYIVKFLARLFMPIMVKKVVKKAEEQFQQTYSNQSKNNDPDEVIINKNKNNNSKKNVGEYIDFEEID